MNGRILFLIQYLKHAFGGKEIIKLDVLATQIIYKESDACAGQLRQNFAFIERKTCHLFTF